VEPQNEWKASTRAKAEEWERSEALYGESEALRPHFIQNILDKINLNIKYFDLPTFQYKIF
jgi:hypothetical protein